MDRSTDLRRFTLDLVGGQLGHLERVHRRSRRRLVADRRGFLRITRAALDKTHRN